MKKTIISILAAGLVATTGLAQLSFGPVVSTGGNSSEGTGVAVSGEITFSTVGSEGTLLYRINNLSGTESYTPGTITGFSLGFDTSLFSYQAGSFDVLNGDTSFSLANVAVTKAINFYEGVAPGPAGWSLDVAVRSGGPNDGLFGGYWAEFEFKFDIADGATFDADTFFGSNSGYSLEWRFQSVGANGQLSDALGWEYEDDGGGGGGGAVPEPSTYGLFGALALLGLMVVRQMRRR
jgi:hypothetical protein